MFLLPFIYRKTVLFTVAVGRRMRWGRRKQVPVWAAWGQEQTCGPSPSLCMQWGTVPVGLDPSRDKTGPWGTRGYMRYWG